MLLLAFGAVQAACVLSFGTSGVCLLGNLGRLPFVSLPPMPYWCGAILGLSLLALCVLAVIGCVWYFAFCRQLFRSYGRFHQNTLAQSRGGAVLPALPIVPQFAPKKNVSCARLRWYPCSCSRSALCWATRPVSCPPETSSSGTFGVDSRIEVTVPCMV